MRELVFCDISFVPDENDSIENNIKKLLEEKGKTVSEFSLHSLRKLANLVDEGFKEFTLNIYKQKVISIIPKNSLHKNYSIWFLFDKNTILSCLFDINAETIINTNLKELDKKIFSQKNFRAENDFFRKEIENALKEQVNTLLKNTNIVENNISECFIAGDSKYIFNIYSLYPTENGNMATYSFPVTTFSELGFNILSNAMVRSFEITLKENNIFFPFIYTMEKLTQNDFIFIYNEMVGCMNRKNNVLHFVSGINEENLQKKVVNYFKDNYVSLPVTVEVAKSDFFYKTVKCYYLSFEKFSDNIDRKYFDIGKLGFW